MRLIDADALIYEDVECVDGNTYMVVHAPQIDNAPTVYDTDKVVEQLERYPLGNLGCQELNEIIDIVKGGGVNE